MLVEINTEYRLKSLDGVMVAIIRLLVDRHSLQAFGQFQPLTTNMSQKIQKRLVVCVNERFGIGQKSCAGRGSRELIQKIRRQLAERQLDYPVTEQVCLGRCEQGIVLRIAPGGPFFTGVKPRDIPAIIQALQHFTADASI